MDRHKRLMSVAAVLTFFLSAGLARAEGTIVIPQSSIEQPGDVGVRAHTNIGLLVPGQFLTRPAAQAASSLGSLLMKEDPNEVEPLLPPFKGFLFETPASLGCIYRLTTAAPNTCNPNVVTAVPTGGSRTIAIVDAFDQANALSDLQHFSTQFGLAPVSAANFKVVFANGIRPPIDPSGGWEVEEDLDIEQAHAFAPGAKIILVEAASNSFTDLLQAEDKAGALIAAAVPAGGEISNSWGGGEFSGETTFDAHFKKPGVVYFASSGDSPGTEWPAVSPFVVSVGGTSTTHNLATGNFFKEVAWQDAGSGISPFEPRPAYQAAVASIVGTHRGSPDVASNSAGNTPVWTFVSIPGVGSGWLDVWGTSAASPAWAGIVNAAGGFAASSAVELTKIYANRAAATDFRDITLGNCGPAGGFFTLTGYDLCTGVGSDQGKVGK